MCVYICTAFPGTPSQNEDQTRASRTLTSAAAFPDLGRFLAVPSSSARSPGTLLGSSRDAVGPLARWFRSSPFPFQVLPSETLCSGPDHLTSTHLDNLPFHFDAGPWRHLPNGNTPLPGQICPFVEKLRLGGPGLALLTAEREDMAASAR